MKVYVDTWIYVTEKFGNMGFIEVYRGILRYETGIYPTIPNFILLFSSVVNLLTMNDKNISFYGIRCKPGHGKKQKTAKNISLDISRILCYNT